MKTRFGLACALALAGVTLAQTTLSDNSSSAASGSYTASGSLALAADFSTDADYLLSSVTLLIVQDTAGIASVSLYSDNSGYPGTLLGTLTSPDTYPTSGVSSTTFTSTDGIALSANQTYWIVLTAPSGSFDWSWTADNAGTGAGFLADSAYFDGTYWYGTGGIYPYQFTIVATPVTVNANQKALRKGQ